MPREIGSEFHYAPSEEGGGVDFPRLGSLVFSGRTAIEIVLTKLKRVKSALIPSYCCESMLAPFRHLGVELRPYDVRYEGGLQVDVNGKADVLLWCNYFGFRNDMPDFDGIIIEDITHSLLSDSAEHPRSDYLVASVRKWAPVTCGGYCSVPFSGAEPSKDFTGSKLEAMRLKGRYLQDPGKASKELFLDLYGRSNRWLAYNYQGLGIDSFSKEWLKNMDVETARAKRRENAGTLYKELSGSIDFLFAERDMDCPLFVPVLIPGNRDVVRDGLIREGIYCPVHWPRPAEEFVSNLYDMELSLICDQRYGPEDMQRQARVIREVLSEV